MLLADDGSIISSQETTPINNPLPVPPAIIPDSAVLGSQDQPQSPPPGVPGFTEFDSGDNGAGSPLSGDINIGDGGAQPMGPLAAPAGFPSAPGNFMAPSFVVPNFNDIKNSVGDLFSGLGGAVHGAANALGNQIQQSNAPDANDPTSKAIDDLFGNWGQLGQDIGPALNQIKGMGAPKPQGNNVLDTINSAMTGLGNYPVQGLADLLSNQQDKDKIGSDLQQAWNDRGNNPFGDNGSLKPTADVLNTIGNTVFNVKTLHDNLAASFTPQMGHEAGNNLADALAGPINFAASFIGPQGKVAIATFVANLISDPKQTIESMGQQIEGFPALVNAFHRWQQGGHAPTGQEIGNGIEAIMVGGMLGHGAYGGIKGIGDRANYEAVKQAGPINEAIARNSMLPTAEDVQTRLNNPRLPQEAGPDGTPSQPRGPVSPEDIAKSFLNKEITSDQVDQILHQNGISDEEFTRALTQQHGAQSSDLDTRSQPFNVGREPSSSPYDEDPSENYGDPVVEYHMELGNRGYAPTDLLKSQIDDLQYQLDHPEQWNEMDEGSGFTAAHEDQLRDHLKEMKAELQSREGQKPISLREGMTQDELSNALKESLGFTPEEAYKIFRTKDINRISRYYREAGGTQEGASHIKQILDEYQNAPDVRVVNGSDSVPYKRTIDEWEEAHSGFLADHLPDGEYGVREEPGPPSNKVGVGPSAVSEGLVDYIQHSPKLEQIGLGVQKLILGEGDDSEYGSSVDFIKELYKSIGTADPTWVSQYYGLTKSKASQLEGLLRQFNQEAGLQPGGDMSETKGVNFPSSSVPHEGPAPMPITAQRMKPFGPSGASLNSWIPSESDESYQSRKAQQSQERQKMIDGLSPNKPTENDMIRGEQNGRNIEYTNPKYQEASNIMAHEALRRTYLDDGDQFRRDLQKGFDELANSLQITGQELYEKTNRDTWTTIDRAVNGDIDSNIMRAVTGAVDKFGNFVGLDLNNVMSVRRALDSFYRARVDSSRLSPDAALEYGLQEIEQRRGYVRPELVDSLNKYVDDIHSILIRENASPEGIKLFFRDMQNLMAESLTTYRREASDADNKIHNSAHDPNEGSRQRYIGDMTMWRDRYDNAANVLYDLHEKIKKYITDESGFSDAPVNIEQDLKSDAWAPKRGVSVGPVDHTDMEGVKKNLEASGQVRFRPAHKVDNGWILPDGTGIQMKDFEHIAIVDHAKFKNHDLTYNDLLDAGYIRMAKEQGGPFTPEILHFDTGDLNSKTVNRIEEYLTTNVIEDNSIPMAVTVSKLPEKGKDVHWSTYSFPFSMKDFVENGFNLKKTIDQIKRGGGHRLFTDIGGNNGITHNGQTDSTNQTNPASQANQGRNQEIGEGAETRNWWKGPNVTDQRPQYAKAIPVRETNAQSTGTVVQSISDLIDRIPPEYRDKISQKMKDMPGSMNNPLDAFGNGSTRVNNAVKEAAKNAKLTNPYGLVKMINKDSTIDSDALYKFGRDEINVNPLAAIPARWVSAMAEAMSHGLWQLGDELTPTAAAEASRRLDELANLDDTGLMTLHLAHEGFHLAHDVLLSPKSRANNPHPLARYSETVSNLPYEYIMNAYERGMNFGVANDIAARKWNRLTNERVLDQSSRLYELIVNDLLHYHNVPGATFAHQAGMEVYANELANPELKAQGAQILGQHFDKLAAQYHAGKASDQTAVAGKSKAPSGVRSANAEFSASTSTDTPDSPGNGESAASNQARLAFVKAHTNEVLNLAKRGVESWDQFVKDLNAPKTELARQTADRILNDLPQKDIVFWKDIAKKVAPVATMEARAAREFKNPASRPRTQSQTEVLAPKAPEVTSQLGSVGEPGAPMMDKSGPADIGRKGNVPVDIGRKYPVVPQEVARSLVANLKLQKFDDPSNLNRFFDKVRANDAQSQAILKKLSPNLRKWVKDNIGLSSQGKVAGEIPVPPKPEAKPVPRGSMQPPPAYFPNGIPGRSDDSRFAPSDTPKTPIAEGKNAAGLARGTRSDDSRFGSSEKARTPQGQAKTPQEFINGIDPSTLTPEQRELLSGIQKQMAELTEKKDILEAAQRAHQPVPLDQKVQQVANTAGHKAQLAAKKVQIARNALDSGIRMGVPPAVLKDLQSKYDIAVSRFSDIMDGTSKVHQTADPVVNKELQRVHDNTAKAVEENLTKVNPEATPQSTADELSRKAGFANWQQVVDIKKGHVQKNYFIESGAGNGRRAGQIVRTPFNLEEGKDYSPVTITGRDGFEWTRDKKTGDITIKDPKHLFLGDHKDVWRALDKDFKSAVNPLFRAGEKPMTPSAGEAAVQHEYSKDKPFEPEIPSPTALSGKEKPNDPKVVRAKRATEKLVAQGVVHPLDSTLADIARLTRSDDPRFLAEEDLAEEESLTTSESRTKQAAIAEKATAYQGVRDLSEEAGNDPLGLNKTSPAHAVAETAGGGNSDEPPPRGPSGDPSDDEYGGPFSHPQNYKKNPYLLKPEEHQAFEKLARGGKDHAKLAAVYRSMMNGFAALNDPALFAMDGRLRAAAIKSQKDRLEFLADRKVELMQKLFTKEQRIAVNDARDEIDDLLREDNINALQTQNERNFARSEEAYYNYKGRVGEAKKIFTRGVEDYYVPRIFKNVPKDEDKIEKSARNIPGFNKSSVRRKMVDTGAVDELGNPILRPKYINIKSLEEATGREAHHDAAVTGLLHDKGFIRSFSTHHMIENFKDTTAFVGNDFAGPLVVSSSDLQDFRNEDMAGKYRPVTKGEFAPGLRGYHVANELADFLERYTDIDNVLSHIQGKWKKWKFAMSPFHYITTMSRVASYIASEDPRWKGVASSATGANLVRALGVWRRGTKLLANDPTRVAEKMIGLGGLKKSALANLPDELQATLNWNKDTKNPLGKLNNLMQDALWNRFVYPIQIGLADWLDETRRKTGGSNPTEGSPEELMHWRSIVQQSEAAVMLVPKEELSNTLKSFSTALVSRDLTMTQVRGVFRSLLPTNAGKKMFDQSLYNLWETAPWHDVDPKVRDWNIKRTTKLARGSFIHMAIGLIAASYLANTISSAIMNMGGANEPINTPLDNFMDSPIDTFNVYIGRDHMGRRQYLTMPLYAWFTEMVNYPLAGMTAHINNDANLKDSLGASAARITNKVMPYVTTPIEIVANQQLWKLMNGYDAKSATLDSDSGVARVNKFLQDNHIPDGGGLVQKIAYALERMDPLPLPGTQAISAGIQDRWPTDVFGGGQAGAIGAQAVSALGERVMFGPSRYNGLTSQQIYHTEQSHFTDQQNLVNLLTAPSSGDPAQDQARWQMAKGIMMAHPEMSASHIANLIKQKQMKDITDAQNAQLKSMNPAEAAYVKAAQKGYLPGTGIPSDPTLYGQSLKADQYSELQTRMLKSRLDTVNLLSSNPSFQGLTEAEKTQQIGDVVGLADTMTRQAYAQELGMQVGNPISAKDIAPVIQKAIEFRNTAIDTVRGSDAFNQSSPSEQQAILQRYGTYAQKMLARQQFGDLKGVDDESIQRMILNSVNNEESVRDYVMNTSFYQNASVSERQKMLDGYSRLTQSVTEKSVRHIGQGEFRDQMINDFSVVPQIKAIINTEETTKGLLHAQQFYQLASDKEQKSLDTKYSNLAKAIADQDLRKGGSLSNPNSIASGFNSGNERVIQGHLMADAALNDLESQFGGPEKIKQYASLLADQEKAIAQDSNASPKTIAYLKNINRQAYLARNPEYAQYLKAKTNWERGTNVGRLYKALNADETTLAANMVTSIGTGQPEEVFGDSGIMYDAFGNILDSNSVDSFADISGLISDPQHTDLAGNTEDSTVL